MTYFANREEVEGEARFSERVLPLRLLRHFFFFSFSFGYFFSCFLVLFIIFFFSVCGVVFQNCCSSSSVEAATLRAVVMSDVDELARGNSKNNQSRRVVFVSGWSPGPLEPLEAALTSHKYEVEWLDVPTPPAGCTWLLNPFIAVLLVLLIGGVVLVKHLATVTLQDSALLSRALCTLGLLVVLVYLARLVVAKLVEYSINDGVNRLLRRLRVDVHGSGGVPALVVGFSWGGCVLHWLLASKTAAGDFDAVPMLLLAPPARVMSSACRLRSPPQFPAVLAQQSGVDGGTHNGVDGAVASVASSQYAAPVAVVTATGDPFCPHPDTWKLYAAAGCEVHTPDDNHVLLRRSSVARIVNTALRLIHDGLGSK